MALGTGYQNRPLSLASATRPSTRWSSCSSGQKSYYRLDVELDGVNDEMDDARDENLAALGRFAEKLITAQASTLDAIVERL